MRNYFVIQDKERNGDEGYYQGACKGLVEIYNSYLGSDNLIPFNGSRR
jgi:hypothetical protein